MIANTITVIIPLYNTEKYIVEAIESLINQTRRVDQIIVVNDGSTDSSISQLSKFPSLEIYQKENSGIVDTLNLGLSKATGDFIGFLDADDRYRNNKLEIQSDLLQKNKNVDVVFGGSINFKINPITQKEEILKKILGKGFNLGLYRRSVFEKVGNLILNPSLNYVIEWHDRANHFEIQNLSHNEIVYERRIHDSNTGILNKEKHNLEYLNTIKASLDRRRAINTSTNEPK